MMGFALVAISILALLGGLVVWALTRVLFRNDCSLKMTVVRLTLV